MELCTARTISNLPHNGLFIPNRTHLRWKTSLPFKKPSISFANPGLLYYTNFSLRSTTSEETSTGPSQYPGEESSVVTIDEVKPAEKTSYAEIVQKEEPKEDFSMDVREQAFEFLDKLDLKLDSDDTYSTILLGVSALLALWVATAVVGAIDSIPLFPKLMEIVGLAYSFWFSTRYLIFKDNRAELFSKIEEIKEQVLGSKED